MELYVRRGKEIEKEDVELKVGETYKIVEYYTGNEPKSIEEVIRAEGNFIVKEYSLEYRGIVENSNKDKLVNFGDVEISPDYFVLIL